MNEAQQRYVEDFGLSRMLGRVLGVLLVRPPERSADELAGMLGS